MPIVEYWKRAVLKNYANFEGRDNRAQYWWFVLGNIIVQVILFILSNVSSIFLILYLGFAIAVLIPGLAAGVRRLHDTDRSGLWLLISLVPCVGAIVLIVFLATPGGFGPNQYGPPPQDLITT